MRLLHTAIMLLLAFGFTAPVATATEAIATCRATSVSPDEARSCLARALAGSVEAMEAALARAQAAAHAIDEARDQQIAVLGVTASQNAWAAYRDTLCQTRAVFADIGTEAELVELACEVELTVDRTETLLSLAAMRGP